VVTVADQARSRFAEGDVPNEVICYGGSVFDRELPTGADIISLVRVVHDHDDDAALAILKRCRQALPQGGTLLLAQQCDSVPPARLACGANGQSDTCDRRRSSH